MRSFRAEVPVDTTEVPTRRWEDVYDSLHKELSEDVYLIPIESVHRKRQVRSMFDEEEKGHIGVFVIAHDEALTHDRILSVVDEGLKVWKINPIGSVVLKENKLFDLFEESPFHIPRDRRQRASDQRLFEAYVLFRDFKVLSEDFILEPLQDGDAMRLAQQSPYAEDLGEEIQRIFSDRSECEGQETVAPVSYIMRTINGADVSPSVDILLASLLGSGRLKNRHCFYLDFNSTYLRDELGLKSTLRKQEEILSLFNAQLRDVLVGNSVVISYGIYDREGQFDNFRYQALTRLLDLLRPVRHRVQIVFAIPEGRPDVELRLKRKFQGAFIDLTPDRTPDIRASREESLDYLHKRAQAEGLVPNEELFELLDQCMEDHTYTDLDDVFNEWQQRHLVTEVFPAYRAIPISSGLQQAADKETAWNELESLIGLSEVKEHIKSMITRFKMNRELTRRGLPVQSVSMHAVFLGPPGTGKTEVARLYAEILKDEGFLSEGRLISLSGNGGFNVDTVFKSARGSVIFIDEAYALGSRTITDLIAHMENRRTETVVILAGYEDAMNHMLDINPGFRSRLGVTLKFPSYNESELFDIFMLLAQRAQLVVDDEAQLVVRDVLSRGGRREDQGNARFVRKLFEDSIGRQQVRLAKTHEQSELTAEQLLTLLPEDIEMQQPSHHADSTARALETSRTSAREKLQTLIGLREVKKLISDHLDFFRIQKEKLDRDLPTTWLPMHMAFRGNPGTGKTEVARIVGKILREEKVLSVGDVYEVGRQDLVAPFVGQTAPKVHDLFRKAKGSVIFIDEAYSLMQGPNDMFGTEAVTTLIDDMEKFRDDVVVILAGYTDEIDDLLATNPGFKSRVKFHVDFPDYPVPELIDILKHMACSRNLVLDDGVQAKVETILHNVPTGGDSGNARFVRNLLEDALVRQATRLISQGNSSELSNEALSTLCADDFKEPAHAPHKTLPVGFAI